MVKRWNWATFTNGIFSICSRDAQLIVEKMSMSITETWFRSWIRKLLRRRPSEQIRTIGSFSFRFERKNVNCQFVEEDSALLLKWFGRSEFVEKFDFRSFRWNNSSNSNIDRCFASVSSANWLKIPILWRFPRNIFEKPPIWKPNPRKCIFLVFWATSLREKKFY